MRAASLIAAMLVATPALAQAEDFRPVAADFALRPRIAFAIRPAPAVASAQRPARIYAIDLAPSPAQPADLHLAIQRRRQRFAPPGAVRTDTQPRSSLRIAAMLFDLPQMDDRLSATIGWQAVKLSNKAVNATSPYSRDDLRVRDDFLPSADMRFAATPRLMLSADYREGIRAYGDSGRIGALGLDQSAFRALRLSLRPERNSRARIGLRWMARDALRLEAAAYDGHVRDSLAFADDGLLPHNLGSAHVRGLMMAAAQRLSPTLDLRLRYDRARADLNDGGARTETRLAAQGEWRHGPWRAGLTLARSGADMWRQQAAALRVECGVDYAPADAHALRIGLHLTDPDRLTGDRLAGSLPSGPMRAVDQARALMLNAALRW
ncbi:TonB-dependent receptor [Sphingobium sp.]|uniref:TonB-dependent receptor domain-containing protein n=1 Tax=Sphingobium sp. TaxID=1912891 RepID=UPI002622F1C3|nr:TonB-dependent receptor [Sphingobium sp.]